jgi:hypothetical protein
VPVAFTAVRGGLFHLIRSGVTGGKTVPESVAANPLVSATATAPSFGAVHGRRDAGRRCHAHARRAPLRRSAEVVHTAIELDGGMTYGTPKTHQRRSVPIPRTLVDALAEHVAGRAPDDLVFTSPRGEVMRNHNFRSRVFAPAAVVVGVPGLTPHGLRHTAASLAVQAGANVKAVQSMLGHASAAMTLDVYAGLFADDLDAVADRLDEAATSARADHLRTEAREADMPPIVLGGPHAV